MKFKEFYNPRHVYDGFFETYFIRPFFHHYADFRGRESNRSCLMSLLAWLVVTVGISGLMLALVRLLGPEVGFSAIKISAIVWSVISLIPLISLLVRTANGAPEQERHPRMLGVDTLLTVSSILFFILGLLMMVTTLNSGHLNPNAGMTDEPDTATFEDEYIREEPIFTYQDEVPAQVEDTVDTLSDMTEPDLANPEESFDPTLSTPDEIEEIPAEDTIF